MMRMSRKNKLLQATAKIADAMNAPKPEAGPGPEKTPKADYAPVGAHYKLDEHRNEWPSDEGRQP